MGKHIIGMEASHHADMAGDDQAIQMLSRLLQERLERWKQRDMVAEDGKILDPLSPCLQQRGCGCSSDGLKTNRKEYNLSLRMLLGELQGIQRRRD